MKVKQRLLSVLLVLCMLVSMLPMVIFTASSKPVAPETIESYYDLYVTGGLKAMFDAFDTANLKLTDLGEGVTDGLWYALVPNEAGKLVKNEALTATVYQADAWTLGDSGFGYSATLAQTRNKSKGEMPGVEFSLSLLTGGDYTVESVLAVTGVKNNSTGEPIKEGGDCYNPISYAVAYGPFAGMTWGIGYRWCYTDTANWNGHNAGSAGMRHWLSTNYNSLRQENTAESFAGSVFNQTVTYDYSAATASAAESATYTLSYNGTLQGSFTSGDSKLAETNRDFFPVDGEKNYFVLLNGMPGSLYNVRIYDHVLTNEEINRNHFADLALLTGLDVSAFNKLSAEDQADLFYATATVGFDIDAAALLKIAETISVAKMKKAFTDYDKLYVGADGTATADGAKLLGLFTAFGKNDVSVDFESAVWYNKVGAQNATMCGAAYVPADDSTGTPASGYWRYYEDGGMGYDLAASDDGVYLSLPIGLLPKTNYTIEVTSAVRGLTKNGAGEEMLDIVDVQYGRMASASKAFFCFGYFNAWMYTGNGSGTTMPIFVGNNLLTMYAEGNAIGWQAAGTATGWAHGSTSMNLYNGYFNKIVAADIVSTVSGGKTTYTAYRDGAKSYSRVFDTINGTGAQSFNMFLSGGNTTYAVRVYSGVLTEGERNLNRFVDLLAYAEVDPTDFLALDSAVRAQIAAQFTTAEFTKDKTTLQEDIDSYIQEIKNAEKKRTMTKYDELYIGADGSTTANGGKLVGLFSAYGKNDVSVSIRTGTWYNKIANADGTYTNATIVGGVYDETTNPTGWKFGEEKGFGYADPAFTATNKSALSFGLNLINYPNVTVEMVSQMHMRDNPKVATYYVPEDLIPTESEDEYLVLPEGKSNGSNMDYIFDLKTTWMASNALLATINGAPNQKVSYTASGTGASNPSNSTGTITLDANGDGVVSAGYTGNKVVLSLPADVTVIKVQFPNYSAVNESNSHMAFVFGSLYGMAWTNLQGSNTWGNGYGTIRWYYSTAGWNGGGMNGSRFSADEANSKGFNGTTASMVFSKTTEDNGSVNVDVWWGGTASVHSQIAKDKVYNDTRFQVYENLPADLFGVRVYSAALTTEEKDFNHFIDLAAYANMDLTEFLGMSSDQRAFIAKMMASASFTTDVDSLKETIDGIKDLAGETDLSQLFYVTDGLKILLAAYNGYSTKTMAGAGSTLWFNAASAGTFGTLLGSGWERLANGGMRFRQGVDEYHKGHNYGLLLDYNLFSKGSFTLELVTTPEGLTTENNGRVERYLDTETTYGENHDYGFVVGPLRCLIFPATRAAGKDGQMEKRWVYIDQGCWNAAGFKSVFSERIWMNTKIDQITTYSITAAIDTAGLAAAYSFYSDQAMIGGASVAGSQFIEESKDHMFQVMYGFPCTIYSLRYYDRELSKEEMLQNHAADLIYYYNLDTSVFSKATAGLGSAGASIYSAFAGMGFDMDPQKAQQLFDERLGSIWMKYDGFSIRTDGADGVRFYFDLILDSVYGMQRNGYDVEIGALVSTDGQVPNFETDVYDYKIVAYDSVAGCHSGFFTDDTTFAVTLLYENADRSLFLKDVKVYSYVNLVNKETGEVMTFYINAMSNLTGEGLFAAYDYARKNLSSDFADLADDLDYIVESCYAMRRIYVDANAQFNGNGEENSPYMDFALAFDACKNILRQLDEPTTVELQVLGGEYGVYTELDLCGADMPYENSRFVIANDDDDQAVLTTVKHLDMTKFEGTAEDYVYAYVFDPIGTDDAGQPIYPSFRYTFADGEETVLAHEGGTVIFDGGMLSTRYERDFEGAYQVTVDMYNAGTLHPDTVMEKYVRNGRTDLEDLFESYRDEVLAYQDALALCKANRLTAAAQTSYADCTATLKSAFVKYRDKMLEAIADAVAKTINLTELAKDLSTSGVLKYEAANEVMSLYNAKSLTAESNPSDPGASPQYITMFKNYRDNLLRVKNDAAKAVEIEKTTNPQKDNKIYLPLDTLYAFEEAINTYKEETETALNNVFEQYANEYAAFLEVQALGEELTVSSAYAREDGFADYGAMFNKFRDRTLALKEATELWNNFEMTRTTESSAEGASEAYKAYFRGYRDAMFKSTDDALALMWENANNTTTNPNLLPAMEELRTAYEAGTFNADTDTESSDSKYKVAYTDQKKALLRAFGYAATSQKVGMDTSSSELYGLFCNSKALDATVAAFAGGASLTEAIAAGKDLGLLDNKNFVRSNVASVGAEFHCYAQWDFNIIHIRGVDLDDTCMYTDGAIREEQVAVYLDPYEYASYQIPGGYKFSGRGFYLRNASIFLDEEGESYYDVANHTLYFYTEDDIEDYNLAYPTMDYMFVLDDVRNFSMFDLEIYGIDDNFLTEHGLCGGQSATDTRYGDFPTRSAIYIKTASHDNVFSGLYIHDCGADGITMRGRIVDTVVEYNVIENIGAAAIRMGGTTADWNEFVGVMDCDVIGNSLYNIATHYRHSSALQAPSAKNFNLQNNTIEQCSYTAISLGWRWSQVAWAYGGGVNADNVDISYNYISSFMTEMADGGAIYMLGGNVDKSYTEPMNFLHHNYILFDEKCGDGKGGMMCGIYHDGSSSNWLDTYNVIVEQSKGADTSGTPLQKRRSGTTFIYIQHIDGQITYNDYCDNNYILNVRNDATMRSDGRTNQEVEVYKTYVVKSRNIVATNTHYYKWNNGVVIPANAKAIISACGAPGYYGDYTLLLHNDY